MGHNLRRINFRFNDLVSKCDTIKHTKRNLLCISGSIFDPLGFIAPVTAKIKTIFQLLCKDKLDWGEIIPEEIAIVWNKIVEELKHLAEVRHSRFVFAENFSSDIVFVTALMRCTVRLSTCGLFIRVPSMYVF